MKREGEGERKRERKGRSKKKRGKTRREIGKIRGRGSAGEINYCHSSL